MKRTIEKVGFVIKPHAPEVGAVLQSLSEYFEKLGTECRFETDAAEILGLPAGVSRESLPDEVDLVIGQSTARCPSEG